MGDCCSPRGYRRIFSERNARAEARRYRKNGLDPTSRRIVDYLKAQGVAGMSVLEVGGGIGAIQIELLKAGAARAVSIELTPTYEDVARQLLDDAGLGAKVERKVMDFAEAASAVEPADLVVLNRVVCCYPDMPNLAGAAASHARRMLVLSFPKRTWWTEIGLTLANLIFTITRREFHIFLHPPQMIVATSEEKGLRSVHHDEGFIWTVAALSRPA